MSRVKLPMTRILRWAFLSLRMFFNSSVAVVIRTSLRRSRNVTTAKGPYVWFAFILIYILIQISLQIYISFLSPILFRFVQCRCLVTTLSSSSCNSQILRNIFQVKPFWCDKCRKSFSSQSKLKQHMLVHSEEKPFMCDICMRAFNVVSNLRRHLRTVHKEAMVSGEVSLPALQHVASISV